MSKILLPILLIVAFVGSTQAASAWTCGSSLTINHNTVGGVAPVNKTVIYGTVLTDIAGTGNKCWITQNLGAARQASSATDSTEASAGWYWQFNRKQGYKDTGSTLTPETPQMTAMRLGITIPHIDENSDWISASDPCTLELGNGWRLPTRTEWENADGAPQNWANYNDTYNSVLRLHTAGAANEAGGLITGRGRGGAASYYAEYWSSTQVNTYAGYDLFFNGIISTATATGDSKCTYPHPVRCLGTPSDIEAGSSGACGIVLSIGNTGSKCRSVKINSSGLFYDGGQVNCPN